MLHDTSSSTPQNLMCNSSYPNTAVNIHVHIHDPGLINRQPSQVGLAHFCVVSFSRTNSEHLIYTESAFYIHRKRQHDHEHDKDQQHEQQHAHEQHEQHE
jgi:hypothetical protein